MSTLFKHALFSIVYILFLDLRIQAQHLIPYRKGKLWGYADSNGVIVVQPRYDQASQDDCGIMSVQLNGKWGVINRKGELSVPTEHLRLNANCWDWMGGLIIIQEKERCLLLNREGKLLAMVDQADIHSRGPNLLVMQGKKYGIISNTGKWILKPCHCSVELSDGGYYSIQGRKTRFYDPSGKLIFKKKLRGQSKFQGGYASVSYYVTDWKHLPRALFRRSWIRELDSDIRRRARLMEKIRHVSENRIDRRGRLVVPEGYRTHLTSPDGAYLVVQGPAGYGIVDSLGRFVLKAEYEEINWHWDGLIRLRKNNLYGGVVPKTWRVLPAVYTYADKFNGNIFVVKKDEKYNLVDTTGKQLYEQDFDWIEGFPGLPAGFIGKRNGKLYWIAKDGKLQLQKDSSEYEAAFPFDADGFSVVFHRDKAGLMNRQGRQVIAPQYSGFQRGAQGFYCISTRSRPFNSAGIIDSTGRLVVDTVHQSVSITRSGRHILILDNYLWGLFDLQGRQLLAQEYKSIFEMDNGYLVLQKDNPEYKQGPVVRIGDISTRREPEQNVPSVLLFVANEDGKVLYSLYDFPWLKSYFYYNRKENGYIRFDGKKFYEE